MVSNDCLECIKLSRLNVEILCIKFPQSYLLGLSGTAMQPEVIGGGRSVVGHTVGNQKVVLSGLPLGVNGIGGDSVLGVGGSGVLLTLNKPQKYKINTTSTEINECLDNY